MLRLPVPRNMQKEVQCSMTGREFLDIYAGSLSAEQLEAVLSDTSTVVSAGAGSGKTTVLSLRFVRLVLDGKAHADEILTITFTKKAAAEMYERIHSLLEKAALDDERMRKELDEHFPKARISTMDSFWSEIARTDSLRYGITRDFSSLEDEDESDMIERIYTSLQNDEKCREGIMLLSELYSSASILSFLKAIASETDILTSFSSNENTESYKLLVEMLRKNAEKEAGSVFSRLADLNAEDDDSKEHDNIENAIALFSSGDYQALPDFEYRKLARKKDKELWIFIKEMYRPLSSRLRSLSAIDSTMDSVSAVSVFISSFISALQKEKRRTGLLSFHDTEALCRRILLENMDVRGWYQKAFRYIMIDEFQDNNRKQCDMLFLLSARHGLAPSRVPLPSELEKDKLFFVGDDKQSIYYFRGADVSVFRALKDDIKSIGGKVLSLSANYRSEPALIEHFNDVFHSVFESSPDENEMKAENFMASFTGERLSSFYADYEEIKARDANPGITPRIETYILPESDADTTALASKADSEAAFIAERILCMIGSDEYLIPGKSGPRRPSFSDIAILLRASALQMPIEKAFRLRGIPYTVAESTSALIDGVGSDIFAFLTLLVYPEDKAQYIALLRSPFACLSDKFIMTLADWNGRAFSENPPEDERDRKAWDNLRMLYFSLREMAGRRKITEILDRMFYESGYHVYLQSSDYLSVYKEHFDYIWSAAALFDGKGSSIPLFLDYLRPRIGIAKKLENVSVQHIGESGVQIMTIHRSKGLQFPIVFIADTLSQPSNKTKQNRLIAISGQHPLIMPSLLSESDPIQGVISEHAARRERAEARRLLYVAMTRSAVHLIVTGSVKRSISPESLFGIYKGPDGEITGEIERIPDIYDTAMDARQRRPLSWYDKPSSKPEEYVYSQRRVGVKDSSHKESGFESSEERARLPGLPSDEIVLRASLQQDFGTMVHSLLESYFSGIEYTPLYPSSLTGSGKAVIADTLEGILSSFLSSDFFHNYIEGHKCQAEVRFFYPYEDAVKEGSVDLLVFGEEYNLAVDYKTDAYMDESMHIGQITAYAEAMEAIYGKKCLAVLLYIRGMKQGTFFDKNGKAVKDF